MATPKSKASKIPKFKSEREERAFWATHSVEKFAGELEELDVEIRPTRTEQIALRLSKDDLEALRAVAKRRGVGHTTLASATGHSPLALSPDARLSKKVQHVAGIGFAWQRPHNVELC